jgi:putative CocE/NonD family hydrolase
MRFSHAIVALLALAGFAHAADTPADNVAEAMKVDFRWGVRIPLRDGVHLNATLYTPHAQTAAAPCIFTLTPYISDSYHNRGMYFAGHGYSFLTVDVRGRGNSEGTFHPLIQESNDGFDVVEWLAKQPYCNGKVAMWGGSYAGYDQWATAKAFPPHLATIVPVASPYAGVDFPGTRGIFYPYDMQWLSFTSGHAGQENQFADAPFWTAQFKRAYEKGIAFRELDRFVGNPSAIFQEWVSHPDIDAYWDSYNPTEAEYAKLSIPILTITGSYDGDQPGALTHYRAYMQAASPEARQRHYLIIGPWDHAGTRTPKQSFGGLNFGAASLLDIPRLHVEWYGWTMRGGRKPDFLKKPVAYYVTGAEKWRYADSLEAITAREDALYLGSDVNPTDVFHAGSLLPQAPAGDGEDHYVYDPRDVSGAALESTIDPDSLIDQQLVYEAHGRSLIYHTAPFPKDTEISGDFRLSAWLGIDRPDTDFVVSVWEVQAGGNVIPLSSDSMRARYRQDPRAPHLVTGTDPLRYDFTHFTFISRKVKQGSRLRLLIGANDTIFSERNGNTGGVVADETLHQALPVTVRLYHDKAHPSALYVPVGQPSQSGEPAPPEGWFTGQ